MTPTSQEGNEHTLSNDSLGVMAHFAFNPPPAYAEFT